MKTFILILFSLGLSSPAIFAQNLTINPVPQQLVCKARDVYEPNAESKVKLLLSTGSDPLIQSIGLTDRLLNFKIGRGNVAGIKVDTAKHEAFGHECTPVVKQDETMYSFEYNCQSFIIDTDGTKKTIHTFKSRIFLTNRGESTICKSLDQGMSPCWTLSECK